MRSAQIQGRHVGDVQVVPHSSGLSRRHEEELDSRGYSMQYPGNPVRCFAVLCGDTYTGNPMLHQSEGTVSCQVVICTRMTISSVWMIL